MEAPGNKHSKSADSNLLESDPSIPTATEAQANWAGFVAIVVVLGFWLLVVIASHFRYRSVPVAPTSTDGKLFSAERAEPILERLYKNAIPHPANNNKAFREQVIGEFEAFGYQVEEHHCQGKPWNDRTKEASVNLTNLIAQLPGTTDLPPLMLTAHFDSVPAGPGVADDGSGLVALLEIARMLKNEPAPKRTVLFVVTDGEEFGLLGARQFVAEHKLANNVASVINLEARGTKGPSIMFETSADSWWLINVFAKSVNRPIASSLFFEIYRALPNDTDFTIFREHGMEGFNFAFIGDVKNYHTPNDNFETLDRGSLQHHGENALQLLRRLDETDIENMPKGRAVYFDILGFVVIRWPAIYSFGLAIAGFILTLCFWRWPTRSEKHIDGGLQVPSIAGANKQSTLLSMSFGLLSIIAAAITTYLLDLGYQADGALENPFPENPIALQASFWMISLTVAAFLTWSLKSRLSPRHVWFGVWILWSILAIAVSFFVTGASHLFIVPVLASGVATLPAMFMSRRSTQIAIPAMVGAVVAGLLWLQMERLFFDALGFQMNIALIVRSALVTSVLLPLLATASRKTVATLSIAFGLATIGLTVVAILQN